MKRSVKILNPGLFSSIQDLGRAGYYSWGIPPSGALDRYSSCAANLLVGNSIEKAVIDATLMGPELYFSQAAIIAVTGADMCPLINDEKMPSHTAIRIPSKTKIKFSPVTQGARAYIAINGGLETPMVLGSRSTYTLGAIGGLNGKKLAINDEIPLGNDFKQVPNEKELPLKLRQDIKKIQPLRVLPGLYEHLLTAKSITNFYTNAWKVSPEADRIGYRFKSPAKITFKTRQQPFGAGSDPSNIVDVGYPIGSIQINAHEAIVLHRDAVSGGGYAMIGTIISADLDLIGQMQPNYITHFIRVNMSQALAARQKYQQRLELLEKYFLTSTK